ncbi:ABC transporter permease [Ancylomarina sp. 16SWW S1-10-2]|uniref:ABC transporter permease n=1 Tax=Ancylomarina sp. 16SWW S1-10-2 TaxID=2499681 RepID=UPI0012AE4779|nr:ABC transporter permease [Ancylomarina sp. 16SWW S1-10-2]MRT93852.1 FtsX-like permease family protein [Ancylomarina sp. 16SWW S1-10-2]
MNFIKLAFRRLFLKGEHSAARIISLATGLAFGILLLSEVFYYYSFDSFYPDSDRIYVVSENYKADKSKDELESRNHVSGAIAPGLNAEVPGVEAATRLNSIGLSLFYTDDKKSYKAIFVLADEHLFDVLPRPMLKGNPVEILKAPMTCMISSEIAENIGGNVIGKTIELKEYLGKQLTIGGVFEALPENTNYKYDVLISMVSTSYFMWDGSDQWLGNDRYYSCVKLALGVKPESLAPAVRKMQEVHQDIEKIEAQDDSFVLKYSFKPIQKVYIENLKDIILILSTIAFAVLFVSLLNYILLTLSVLVERSKSSAIYKTFGAHARHLRQIIFSESALIFLISLFAAFILIIVLQSAAEQQVGHQLQSVLNPYVILPLMGILIFILILMSYLPARFFSRIPVANAFRHYHQKKNKWKLVLLSFQFVGASFILCMLVIVSLQYDNMKNSSHGYQAEGVFYGSTSGMEGTKIASVLHDLRSMPEIEKVGFGATLPCNSKSGNNILSLDEQRDLFNVADFYTVDNNYLSILDVKVTEGQLFPEESTLEGDVLISKKGAKLLQMHNAWDEGVVGKQIVISEHGSTTIKGVFSDFTIGSKAEPDTRPAVFFYRSESNFVKTAIKYPSYSFNILVKTYPSTQAGTMNKIREVFNTALPYKDANIKSLEMQQEKGYTQQRGFRNAMMAGSFIILLITIIGLLGYTTNEAVRRRKELAIRRINGAKFSSLLKVFLWDIEIVAAPAVLFGSLGAWFTANLWMQNFAYKLPLHWWLFFICSLIILLLVALVTVINFTRNARQNPVESLRYE